MGSRKEAHAKKALNLLDRAVLGLAFMKMDMDYRDKWAILFGKAVISISISYHILIIFRDVLGLSMPSRLIATIIGFMIAAICYVPVHLVTRPAEAFQELELSAWERWVHRAWGLIIGPVGWLVWLPLWFFVL